MAPRIKIAFLILVLTQGVHLIEEYSARLWEELPSVRSITSLVSDDPGTGFLIINTGFFLFGIWCIMPVLREYSYAPGLIWFWSITELINGILHSIWALYAREYIPGMVTAPILLVLAVYLLINMTRIDNNKSYRS